ncbi:MAG: cupin domain-containing protein [Sedimentisphaerales bacterium]|nr:cupin domain-containing protein [Sedimentisphaerales bacterium]
MYLTDINDEIMCISKSGNKIYWMLTNEIGAENFELRYIEIPPGGKSSYGRHTHEHEVFVVEGKGSIRLKDGQEKLRPGLAVFVSGGEEHQWINTSKTKPLGFVCVVPKGAEAELKPPCE